MKSRLLFLIGASLTLAYGTPVYGAPQDGAVKFDEMIAEARGKMLGNPRGAIAAASAAERVADELPESHRRQVMRATAQWLAGEAHLRIDETDDARPLIESAYRIAKEVDPNSQLFGDVLASLGGVMGEEGRVAQALQYYQQSYQVYRDIGDARSQSKALIQIAILYYGANDWTSSLKYFAQAIDTYDADQNLAFSIHNGRGNALKELHNERAARAEFGEALAIAQQMKSPLLEATVYNNLARMALETGDLGEADRAIAGSLDATGAGAPPEFRKQQWALAAQAAYQHGNYTRAAWLIERTFAGADLAETTLTDRDAHRTAYLVYQELGRDDLALAHLRAWKRLDDDATTLARSANAALMGARFDFANQALKIANLKADDAQKSAAFERSRAQTQRLVFMGAAFATVILMGMLLYALRTTRRSRERVQAANKDLAITNDALGKALAAKTEFLATTSHEIRTPLNGILGMTQVMLVDRTLDNATRDRLAVVHDAGTTMKALVDDILDVAKMETGNLTIEERPFDLKSMIMAASELWEAQAKAKGLDFARNLDECPKDVCGDGPRVRQILFNLLSNAIKFTKSGEVALAVSRATDGSVRLTVRDTGIGIEPDKIETIFESFKQADTGTTRQFGGTGLGLTISRNLARAMGGDVTATSVVGEGTEFAVTLPLPAISPGGEGGCDGVRVRHELAVVGGNPIARSMLKALVTPTLGVPLTLATLDDAIATQANDDIATLLIDGTDIAPDVLISALPRLACGGETRIALLWPEAESHAAQGFETDLLILKPVTGAVLLQRLTDLLEKPSSRRVVSEAA